MFYAVQDKLSWIYTGLTIFRHANFFTIFFIVISNAFDLSSGGYVLVSCINYLLSYISAKKW